MATSPGPSEEPASKKKRGSALHCCVPQCSNDSRYNSSLSFHRFPKKNGKLRARWIVKIRRDIGESFQLTEGTRVCSVHFLDEDFLPPGNTGRRNLKKDAFPSVFNWSAKTTQRREIVRQVESETQTDESDVEPEPPEAPSQLEQDYEAARNEIQILRDQLKIAQLEVSNKEAEARALKEAAVTTKEVSDAKIQKLEANLSISRFGLERFSKDNTLVRFYTGFPTYDHFKLFFELVKPTAETIVYVYASGIGTNRPGVRNMLLIDELFLFCVRLKLGLFELDLAQRFVIHVSSVSRKVATWANFLYFFLGNQPIWPTRESINEMMPGSFKELYPSTRVIIDCTEIHVQTPSSLLLQSQLYSSYKSYTTLKGLIGIAPHGAITFVSSLYTGSISDKEITRCCGILDLLEANDSVMADKGFEIEDLLRSKQVSLNLPPFLQSQTQFSAQDVKQTKTIAKVRIHVERAIRRIKEFHIFDSDIKLSTLGSVNQLYTVACLLTNFQGALIKDTDDSGTSDN